MAKWTVECQFVSPLTHVSFEVNFRSDSERVLFDHTATDSPVLNPTSFELAGPRENLYFDPGKTTAAIVTCGGLCPGLNDIIRGLVTQCHNRYGITRTYGFRYGYQGLISRYGFTPMTLRPESVSQIHNFGGSILGTSRGHQDIGEMVDLLEEMKVDIFFVVGGDGTLRGASAIAEECSKRGLKKSIVGIPKTIDNDIMYLDKSFGFETAFAMAVQSVRSAYVESTGSLNGIGLLKLMGRDSGFIACYAALAGSNVDFVLIPEVHFELEGSGGSGQDFFRECHRVWDHASLGVLPQDGAFSGRVFRGARGLFPECRGEPGRCQNGFRRTKGALFFQPPATPWETAPPRERPKSPTNQPLLQKRKATK